MSNHELEGPRPGSGDPALERAWRQASDEVPPPRVDAAILAAAAEAIQGRDAASNDGHAGRRSRNWLTSWQPLAAAAGVAGLAFVLVQTLPRERDVAPSIRMEETESRPTGAMEQPSSPPAPEAQEEKAAVADEPASAEASVATPDEERVKRTIPPPPPASAPVAEAPVRALDRDASDDAAATMRAKEFDARQATMPEVSSEAAPAAAAAPARQMGISAPQSAEDRAARVAALYAAGDLAGAAAALRAFRLIEPDADAYLPESLREWARTVE